MGDLVDKMLNDIRGRLKELEPLVSEYRRLQEADQALGSNQAPSPAPARGTRSRRSSQAPARRGDRRNQVLAVIDKRPGIRTSALAKELDISSSNGFGLVKRLIADGQVRKADDGALMIAREGEKPAKSSSGRKRGARGKGKATPAGTDGASRETQETPTPTEPAAA